MTDSLRKVCFIPDCHHPYVDKRAWKLLLDILADQRPHEVIIMGDFVDAAAVGEHTNNYVIRHRLEEELEAANEALDQLEVAALGAKFVYLEGNHEDRLARYIAKHAPALEGLVSIPEALRLGERKMKFVPYRKTYRLGKLRLTHDTGSAGMNAHRSAAAAHHGSTAIAHTHRLAYEVRGTFDGLPFLAAMFGWLGDPKQAGRYVHEAKSASEWALGLGWGLQEASGIVHAQPVPIVNYRCVVAGKLYRR